MKCAPSGEDEGTERVFEEKENRMQGTSHMLRVSLELIGTLWRLACQKAIRHARTLYLVPHENYASRPQHGFCQNVEFISIPVCSLGLQQDSALPLARLKR